MRGDTVRVAWLWTLLASALIAWAFVRTAAVTEDAFITFRVIDNAINGYGLVWNVGERVQPYTHPLWALLLLAAASVTGELFHTALSVSLLLTLCVAGLLTRFARGRLTAVWVVLALLFSEAFIEYSSAALENALAHALVAALIVAWKYYAERVALVALLAGLLVITRHDFAVLVAPLLLGMWLANGWTNKGWAIRWRVILWAGTPLFAWSIFSLIYYGSPWPNSAYAKLNNGLSLGDAWTAAVPYFRDVAKYDAVTALVIVVGGVRALLQRGWGMRLPALGLVLYLLYLGAAGGDYMGGRLFSTPFVMALAMIAVNVRLRWSAPLWLAITIGLGLQRGWLVRDVHPHAHVRPMSQHAWMYPTTGWLSPTRQVDFRDFVWAKQGLEAKRDGHQMVAKCAVGLYGLSAGPGVYIVDPLAITDGFLARLPAKRPAYPGHFERAFPLGYVETKVSGTPQLKDPHLARLYALTESVSKDPLFSEARWHAIWALNSGQDKLLMKQADYDPNQIIAPDNAPVISRDALSCMGQLDPLLTVRLK